MKRANRSANKSPKGKFTPKKKNTDRAPEAKIDFASFSKYVQQHGRRRRKASIVNPFVAPQHPPTVTPAGGLGLARDDATAQSMEWAAQSTIASAFSEGLMFMGYPYLAQLTQRPEYRRAAEIIATEMTRKWIKLQVRGEENKDEKISKLEAELERLNVRDKFKRVAEQDGFFGRAHLFFDFGVPPNDPDELKIPITDAEGEPTSAKISKGSLVRIANVEAVWCYPTNYNSNDPLSPKWYKPDHWFVMGKQVHRSRLLTFVGREVPDLLKPAYSFGGLSLSQLMKPYVDNWLRTRQSVSDLVHSFTVFVLSTNMQQLMSATGDELFSRADQFNDFRDNHGLLMIDKDGEEFNNISTSLASLDKLQAQSQEQVAAISGIPLIKFWGLTPSGLNATAEPEIRVFYDWINAFQRALFSEQLTYTLKVIQLSLFGEVDPDIVFEFEPLWSMTLKEQAEVKKLQAETDAIAINSGVLHPVESRARLAHDVDTPYHGIDVDDIPEPDPLMLESGLEMEEEHGVVAPHAEPLAKAKEIKKPNRPKPGESS